MRSLSKIFVIAAGFLGVSADTIFPGRYVRLCEASGKVTTDSEYISSALSAFDSKSNIRDLVIYIARSKGYNVENDRVDLDLMKKINPHCCGVIYPKFEDYDQSFTMRTLRYIFGIDEYTVEMRTRLNLGPNAEDYTGRPSATLRAWMDRCAGVWETSYGLYKIEQMDNGEFR